MAGIGRSKDACPDLYGSLSTPSDFYTSTVDEAYLVLYPWRYCRWRRHCPASERPERPEPCLGQSVAAVISIRDIDTYQIWSCQLNRLTRLLTQESSVQSHTHSLDCRMSLPPPRRSPFRPDVLQGKAWPSWTLPRFLPLSLANIPWFRWLISLWGPADTCTYHRFKVPSWTSSVSYSHFRTWTGGAKKHWILLPSVISGSKLDRKFASFGRQDKQIQEPVQLERSLGPGPNLDSNLKMYCR